MEAWNREWHLFEGDKSEEGNKKETKKVIVMKQGIGQKKKNGRIASLEQIFGSF